MGPESPHLCCIYFHVGEMEQQRLSNAVDLHLRMRVGLTSVKVKKLFFVFILSIIRLKSVNSQRSQGDIHSTCQSNNVTQGSYR